MSMMLTPLSRYRSYGGALHQRANVIRSVEHIGRFRRSYSFNPVLGVSSTRTAQEHYRLVTDWKTPFEEQLRILSTELDRNESRVKSIRDSAHHGDHPHPKELQIKIQTLSRTWDGLKHDVENRRQRLAEAKSATEYMNSINGYDDWKTEQEKSQNATFIVAITTREHQEHHQDQVRKMSATIKETAEKAEKLNKERLLISNLASDPIPLHHNEVVVRSTSAQDIPRWKQDFKSSNGSLIRIRDIYTKTESSASTSTLNSWRPELPAPSSIENGPRATLEVYGLHARIDDILKWIADRETITEAQELGQNYEHVQALQKQFQSFVHETEFLGSRKVANANRECDRIISSGQSDGAMVALWKDNLNEAWENLLELMHTWTLLLEANLKLQKFFYDCREIYGQIQEKMRTVPDELSRDAGTFSDLQRKHQGLMSDLKTLEIKVRQLQNDGDELLTSYAGDKAAEIKIRQTEVLSAWRQLQLMCDYKRFDSGQSKDLFKFMQMTNDLTQWMEAVKRKLYTQEKPRDIRSVESLASTLEAIKSDMDLHEESFVACISLGRELLAEQHYGAWEVEKKLLRLTTERADLMRYWANRWEHLRLVLQVYKSAKEDPVVELVPISQRSRHASQNNVDEAIRLINRCKVMDDQSMAQTELLQALERMTLLDLKELHRRQLEESKKWRSMSSLQPQDKVETTFGAENILRLETTLGPGAVITRQVLQPSQQNHVNHSNSFRYEDLAHVDADLANGTVFEGALWRKRTWDSMDKRASNRAWENVYCVLRGNKLHFYRDFRHKEKREPLRGNPINLDTSYAEVSTEYTKRPHVFSLRYDDGAEFLFQARNDIDMYRWVHALQAVSGPGFYERTSSNRSPVRSISPHSSSSSKMRSFFDFKKKF